MTDDDATEDDDLVGRAASASERRRDHEDDAAADDDLVGRAASASERRRDHEDDAAADDDLVGRAASASERRRDHEDDAAADDDLVGRAASASERRRDHEDDAAADDPSATIRMLQFGLVTLAALALVVSLVSLWRASGHDAADVERAEARDAVLITARGHIEKMNALDYRDVAGGLKQWEAITTGTLHDQIANTSAEDRQLLQDQQKVSVGKVVDAAVVDLDGNTATVIAAVEVTVKDATKPDEQPSVKRNRFAADLVKVGDKWLLETLDQVAVNLS